MNKFLIVAAALFACTFQMKAQSAAKNTDFVPKSVWNDTDGNPINAHGAGILKYKNRYYLYEIGRASCRERV